jgi:hypothetical protein
VCYCKGYQGKREGRNTKGSWKEKGKQRGEGQRRMEAVSKKGKKPDCLRRQR